MDIGRTKGNIVKTIISNFRRNELPSFDVVDIVNGLVVELKIKDIDFPINGKIKVKYPFHRTAIDESYFTLIILDFNLWI